jgi:hypothetical protein
LITTMKNARATDAARVLRDLYRDQASIKLGVDDKSNSLIVAASPAILTEVAKILQTLDDAAARVVDDNHEFYVIRLRNLEADQKLLDALRMLLPNAKAGRFVLDPGRKLLLVQGPPWLQKAVETALLQIEAAAPVPAAKGLQVRLLWLVGGKLVEGDGGIPASVFQDVADDLKKLALNPTRIAGNTLVHVTAGARFTISGSAVADGPYVVKFSGKAGTAPDGMVELAIEAVVMAAGDGGSARLCELQTELRVPAGKMVVVGSAPVRGEPTAFIVHVAEVGSAKAAAKKAAANQGP